ncbi:major facilitator superfamily domain-containing protein [Melampsora americana]|nr:major facilitator superfamily domain-containing protein [Melampsora americana]
MMARLERQPLLPPSNSHSSDDAPPKTYSSIEDSCYQIKKPTPLPKKQLAILCVMRFTEPISFTVIFPFINQMIEDLGIASDRTHVGYYAGLIESLFAFAQLCTALYWGRLSDRIGRKPVILTGLLGLAVSVISFGLQSSLTGLIVTRALAGMMNGNIGILRSVIREITDHTNHAAALALLPLCYAIGGLVGPLCGGYLARPAEQYPYLFGNIEFLKRYPYFLPGFVAGMFNLGAILLGMFYLEESLPSKCSQDLSPEARLKLYFESRKSISPPNSITNKTGPVSITSLLDKKLLGILLGFFMVNLQSASWSSLVPLFAYTRITDGGLSLSLDQIGFCLSANGIGLLVVQLLIFPPLQRRIRPLRLYRYTLPTHALGFVLLPFLSLMVKGNSDPAVSLTGLTATLILKSPGLISIVCISIMLNNAAPLSSLGTLNGLAMTCTALSYTVGPILASSLFSYSIHTQHFLGGNLVWVVMLLISFLCYVSSWLIEEEEHSPSKIFTVEDDEE